MQDKEISGELSYRAVILAMLMGFLVNLIPLAGWAQLIRPDVLLLVLVFWGINFPGKVSFFVLLFLGLLMDVGNGSILGQSSLLYLLIVYFTVSAHRRIRPLKSLGQMLHLLPVMIVVKLAILGLLVLVGASFPGWSYFYPVLTTAIIWPLVQSLLDIMFSRLSRK